MFRWTSATTASQYIQAVFYWIIFVVGVPGNLLVLHDSSPTGGDSTARDSRPASDSVPLPSPGNLLALAVVVWKLSMSAEHHAMSIFVGSLAVSDLGLLLTVTWINALLSVDLEWPFGKIQCQMYALWRSLAAECSIVNLMIISVDRFAARLHRHASIHCVSKKTTLVCAEVIVCNVVCQCRFERQCTAE